MRKIVFIFLFTTSLSAQIRSYDLNLNFINDTQNVYPFKTIRSISFTDDSLLYLYLNDGFFNAFPINKIKMISFSENPLSMINVDPGNHLPQIFTLLQNYPNPFNPTTTIEYHIENPGEVEINIFNSLGQVVRTFSINHVQKGRYRVLWDGKNSRGETLATGIYIYQIKCGNHILAKRMIYTK